MPGARQGSFSGTPLCLGHHPQVHVAGLVTVLPEGAGDESVGQPVSPGLRTQGSSSAYFPLAATQLHAQGRLGNVMQPLASPAGRLESLPHVSSPKRTTWKPSFAIISNSSTYT